MLGQQWKLWVLVASVGWTFAACGSSYDDDRMEETTASICGYASTQCVLMGNEYPMSSEWLCDEAQEAETLAFVLDISEEKSKQECAVAMQELWECLDNATCEQLDEWVDETYLNPCFVEESREEAACGRIPLWRDTYGY